MKNLPEQYLVHQVWRFQDRESFEELYRRYYDKIYRFVLFRIRSKEEVDDLVSQVFLNTWEYLTKEKAQEVLYFKAFLYKIARNLIINVYRVQGRMPVVVTLDDTDDPLDVEDQRPDPFLEQLNTADWETFGKAFHNIKDEYKEVLALRFLEGVEIGEIAKMMNKTPGNIRVLIHRAFKALKRTVVQQQKEPNI